MWFQTVWLYLLPTSQLAVWDNPFFWLGLIYVTFPLNFLVYGWNDIVDFPIDKANPRKDSWLFGARASMDELKRIPAPMVMVQVPFFAAFAVLDPLRGLGTIFGIMLVNFLYNDRRIAWRGRPPFDLLNPLGYLIVLYLGIWLNQAPYVSWLTVLYLALFCMHAHVMGEIMDYHPDKAAGRTTSVVRLGTQRSKGLVACLVLAEAALVWFGFQDLWLTGFLVVGFIWLLIDLFVLFAEKEYTPAQFRMLGVFMNLSGYGSITYLWVTGALST